jgi:hypothetical protein
LKKRLAILIPLYKSESNIESLIKNIDDLRNILKVDTFVRFIVDGRNEDLAELIKSLRKRSTTFEYDVVKLSKNFGVGPALLAGMQDLNQEIITAMSADGQEPLSLYESMIEEMNTNDFDLCLGVRTSRKDQFIHRIGAIIFWKINQFVLGKEIPSGGFDVFMINQKVKNEMVKLNELNSSFTSQMFWLGFDRKFIKFERKKREFGKSGWTIKKKIKLFFDSIFGFTQLPILIMTYLSLSLILFSLAFLLLSIYIKIKGIYTIPGYLTTASLIVLGNGVTYLFLSIIGGYVYRNFQNGTGRSSFIISRTYSKSQIEL